MGTLEELLRAAAARGLTHLTLYPVDSNDGKRSYWHARATPSTAHGYVQMTDEDPVKAVTRVLEALPSAKRRNLSKHTEPQMEVTAAVTKPADTDEWEKFK